SSGDAGGKKLYHARLKEAPTLLPLEAALQTSLSSPLLTCAQDIPDVEEDLRKLRKRQLKDRTKAVYIPPHAKASRQAADSASFDLMKNMHEFLKSDLQVFLLLGDSGAGKSTFNRQLEHELWTSYSSEEDAIPLFVHLPSIDNPGKDLVAKHLRRCDFLEPQIRELKNTRRFTLICDGYDECQQIHNLYTGNNLNGEGQWKVKMVISCRSEHLGHDYKGRFQPSTDAANSTGASRLQEAAIVPFSTKQIEDYINRYVTLVKPPWRAKSYLTVLGKIPSLMDLIRNPFLLTLSLDVLPGLVDVDKTQDLSDVNITRVGLYDRFVEHWLERGKKRVGDRDMSPRTRAAFDTLVDEGFTANGIDFLKRLAAAIYKEQAGHPIVEYSRFKDGNTWKAEFFSREDESRLLREA
ncbi:Transducin (beta)-like 1 X-linked receptor 1, partial [Mortierella alpina]